MKRNRAKYTGRRESGTHTAIPHAVQDSPNFKALSGSACKVLLAIARQFNGFNNGDLCASFSVLRKRGIRSPDTLNRALAELKHYGLIELTRQGGLNAPNLYALTWNAIDDCKGKLHVASTRTPSGLWKHAREALAHSSRKRSATTESVQRNYESRISELEKAA